MLKISIILTKGGNDLKNSIKTLAVWLIIGIILVVAISTVLENSNTKLAYSELIAKIEASQVEEIELEADGYSANVKLKNENINYLKENISLMRRFF